MHFTSSPLCTLKLMGHALLSKVLAIITHLMKQVLWSEYKVWINNMVKQIARVVSSYINELK